MKTRNFLFGIIVFAVAVGLAVGLVGCGKSDSLVGTWKGKEFNGDAFTMTFTKDTVSFYGETLFYKIKDNVLVIWEDDEEDSDSITYKINGDKLSLASPQDDEVSMAVSMELTRIVSKSGNGSKALIGTWEGIEGITLTFTGNKFTQSHEGIKTTVPYKTNGNSISTEYGGAEVERDFEIDGDTLTIAGFDMEFKRVSGKQETSKMFSF
jgi:hypothetical protein